CEPRYLADQARTGLQVTESHHESSMAAFQRPHLICDADSATQRRRDRSASDAHSREGTDSEDEARREHDVQAVGDPERTHCACCVSGATEDRIHDEEEKDRDAAAEHDGGVAVARGYDTLARAHQSEEP